MSAKTKNQIFATMFMLTITLFKYTTTAPQSPSREQMIQSFTQFLHENVTALKQHKQSWPTEINQHNLSTLDFAKMRYLVRKVAMSLKVLRIYVDDTSSHHHTQLNKWAGYLEDEIVFFNQARRASINMVSEEMHELQSDQRIRPLTHEYARLLDEKTALHYNLVRLPSL